jgi:5-methylcytosine-specific restriction protein A
MAAGSSSRKARVRTLAPRVTMVQTGAKPLGVMPGATARLSDRSGHAWAKIREQVLREEPLCRPCRAAGRVAASTEVDHIQPLEQGGADDRANLQGICAPCHRNKSARERTTLP